MKNNNNKNLKLLKQNFLKLNFFLYKNRKKKKKILKKNKIKLINIKLKQQKYYNKFSNLKYNLKLNQICLNLIYINILIKKKIYI